MNLTLNITFADGIKTSQCKEGREYLSLFLLHSALETINEVNAPNHSNVPRHLLHLVNRQTCLFL